MQIFLETVLLFHSSGTSRIVVIREISWALAGLQPNSTVVSCPSCASLARSLTACTKAHWAQRDSVTRPGTNLARTRIQSSLARPRGCFYCKGSWTLHDKALELQRQGATLRCTADQVWLGSTAIGRSATDSPRGFVAVAGLCSPLQSCFFKSCGQAAGTALPSRVRKASEPSSPSAPIQALVTTGGRPPVAHDICLAVARFGSMVSCCMAR